MCTCVRVYMCVCMYVCMNLLCMYVCMNLLCMYVFVMYVCTYVCGMYVPIPVAVRSKAWVFSRFLAGTAGSNPAGGMTVYVLSVLCIVR